MADLFEIRPRPIYRAEKPVRDREYRRYVKQHPCVACRKTWRVDPCHTGPHGIGQKACDLKCIPLCRTCHDLYDADPQGFARENGLNVALIVARLNRAYFAKPGKKAA